MLRRSAAVFLALAVCVLPACTSSKGSDNDSGPRSAPASTTSSHTSSAPTVTQPSSLPASPPNKKGVIRQGLVSITSCRSTAHGWQAVGVAKGANGTKASYLITVYFTTDQATVQAFGQTTVKVAAGKTTSWTIARRFRADPQTRCVIVGAG